jgi:hypothetical protein
MSGSEQAVNAMLQALNAHDLDAVAAFAPGNVDEQVLVTDFWLVNDWLAMATQMGATLHPPI